jgi:hypothetical protein
VPSPASDTPRFQLAKAMRIDRNLFPDIGQGSQPLLTFLTKQITPQGKSNQAALSGLRAQPANFAAMSRFVLHNVYHSVCIAAKVNATVGLGLKKKETEKALDPLCKHGFTLLNTVVCEDFHSVGNGYYEVVRDGVGPKAKILALHPFPAPQTFIYVEEASRAQHLELVSGSEGAGRRKFPLFGDSERFYDEVVRTKPKAGETVSEIIHVPFPTALNRWYGLPRWLAAVASIELMQALDQREFDFFVNRGVPEFMLFITGGNLKKEDWKKLENALNAQVGLGNSHKSCAINIPESDAKVQVEKLDLEGTDQGERYATMTDTLALKITSAHQIPPLLAGIQIPGKLGANNELPNAIRAFQVLSVDHYQRVFENTLGRTLGNPEINGGLAVGPEDFLFNEITDQLDLNAMATSTAMRQTEPEAAAEGRDLADGVKKELTTEQADAMLAFVAAGVEGVARARRAAASA